MSFAGLWSWLGKNKWVVIAAAMAFTAYQGREAYVARQAYTHPATKTAEAASVKRNVVTVTHVVYRADGSKAEETTKAEDKTTEESAKTAESAPVLGKRGSFLSVGARASYGPGGALGGGAWAEVGVLRVGVTNPLAAVLAPTYGADVKLWSW